jgi:hypothetical protein
MKNVIYTLVLGLSITLEGSRTPDGPAQDRAALAAIYGQLANARHLQEQYNIWDEVANRNFERDTARALAASRADIDVTCSTQTNVTTFTRSHDSSSSSSSSAAGGAAVGQPRITTQAPSFIDYMDSDEEDELHQAIQASLEESKTE